MRIDEVKELIEHSRLDVLSLRLELGKMKSLDYIKNVFEIVFSSVSFDPQGDATFLRPTSYEINLLFDNKELYLLFKKLKIEAHVDFFDAKEALPVYLF